MSAKFIGQRRGGREAEKRERGERKREREKREVQWIRNQRRSGVETTRRRWWISNQATFVHLEPAEISYKWSWRRTTPHKTRKIVQGENLIVWVTTEPDFENIYLFMLGEGLDGDDKGEEEYEEAKEDKTDIADLAPERLVWEGLEMEHWREDK